MHQACTTESKNGNGCFGLALAPRITARRKGSGILTVQRTPVKNQKMKKQLIEYSTEEGIVITVEVEPGPAEPGGTSLVSGGGTLQKASARFEEALEPLRKISGVIINKIKALDTYPDEISVELGLKFSAKAGVILTSVDSEANLKINLKWKIEPVR